MSTTRKGTVMKEEGDVGTPRNGKKEADESIPKIVMTTVMILIATGNEKILGTKKEQSLRRLHMSDGERALEKVDTLITGVKTLENDNVTTARRRESALINEAVTVNTGTESRLSGDMKRLPVERTQGKNE